MPKYDSPPFDSLAIQLDQHHQPHNAHIHNPFFTGRPTSPIDRKPTPTTDRHDLIRRIKHQHQGPTESPTTDQNALGLDILRPRSALHRGDFHEQHRGDFHQEHRGDFHQEHLRDLHQEHLRDLHQERQPQQNLATSPVVPWHQDFPALRHGVGDHASLLHPARPRAVSQASLSQSFSYQPPTSPLVHQANAADIPDYPSDHHSPPPPMHPYHPRHASLRAFPYQAHQPRRSITSMASLPPTPFLPNVRRPSISDASPLQHAPMVGSYEESILRGRMSTTPSKPLDFVAQIGVLGKGNCKSSLKCPSHVTIPFPAVFYSYASGSQSDPEPSPYVGMVDLENSLRKSDDSDATRRRRRHLNSANDQVPSTSRTRESTADDQTTRKRRQQKLARRDHSPKAPPGGSYRIPQVGQLQIVLKNPNKTAVKLFLVPYDLSDMEPGTKTFIRQRSYSAGPLVDMPISSRKNYGTDRPEAAIGGAENPDERPVLRYLIHLHICCPSRGRYYLYQNIRVVFANRVPDGKEKLRSEIQMPEPRYSAFKPNVLADPSTIEVQKRRSSAVFPSSQSHHYPPSFSSRQSASVDSTPHPLFLHSYKPMPTLESRPASRGIEEMDVDTQPSPPVSPTMLVKRFTFERERARDVPRAESLLSRKLRDLEMEGVANGGSQL